jgi:hypothetical protein
MNQLSTPMPILNLRVSGTTQSGRRRHSTIRTWESSCCPTISSVLQTLLMRFYWLSCRAHMKQLQHVVSGIGLHWSVSTGADKASVFSWRLTNSSVQSTKVDVIYIEYSQPLPRRCTGMYIR